MKVNYLLFGSALALLAGVTFTSCSSDDVAEGGANPSFDGSTVKTQFAINVATPRGTRMSDENTQIAGNFLGIGEIKLFTFSADPAAATDWTRNLTLGDISGISAAASSKIYGDVEIPVGTKNFLFYGFAPMGTDMATKFQKGVLKKNFPSEVTAAPSGISVELEKILTSDMSTIQGYYTTYLNSIKNVTGWNVATDVSLQNAYNQFTTIGATGVRAGSAIAVLKTVENLYNLAIDIKEHSSSTEVDNIADAIMTAITATGDINVTKTLRADGKHYDLAYENNTDDKYKYPVNFGLPEGAAQLAFDNVNGFTYKNTPTLGASGSTLNVYGLTYPASIAYTANTAVKASTEIFDATEWPKTVANWDNATAWSAMGTWTDVVSSTTRSVALANNINYSVASLKTTVKCNEASLKDNRANIFNDGHTTDQIVSIPAGGFKVTGVLIGGQPNKVDWQYLDNASERNAVIYDKDVTDVFAGYNLGSPKSNYTLVFDNWKNDPTQDDVLIAIELENGTGTDFYGVDGVILKDQKFYLVAKLECANGTGTITWPATAYRYPQTGKNRVFMQDYTTVANLNIKSLKNAYSTVPDLRSIQLHLGLSVDLTWQSGLTFEVGID